VQGYVGGFGIQVCQSPSMLVWFKLCHNGGCYFTTSNVSLSPTILGRTFIPADA
jgi:hypothetical protein